jgi:lysophospholipase L1-like esterase
MTIHAFGDSHASYGWNSIDPKISIHCIYGKICYSIGRDGIDKFNIKDLSVTDLNVPITHNECTIDPVKDGDIVLFSAGEIDCRCHIDKYITNENSYENIINNMIEKYFDLIQENIKQYNDLTVLIYNVLPPLRKIYSSYFNSLDIVANDDDRKTYVLYFNKTLKEYCLKYNYLFVDIYDEVCDSEGFLNKDICDYMCHINFSYNKPLYNALYKLNLNLEFALYFGDSQIHSQYSNLSSNVSNYFNLESINNAVLGDYTDGLINRLNAEKEKYNYQIYYAKFITILYGTNDSRNNDPLKYKENLRFIINYIRNISFTVRIILITPPACDLINNGCVTNESLCQYASTCIEIACELDCDIIDLYSLTFKHNEYFAHGGYHLNDLGNNLLYNEIINYTNNNIFTVLPHDFNDTFKIKLYNDILIVLRTDSDCGWGLDLRILAKTPTGNKIIDVGPSYNNLVCVRYIPPLINYKFSIIENDNIKSSSTIFKIVNYESSLIILRTDTETGWDFSFKILAESKYGNKEINIDPSSNEYAIIPLN